MPALISITNPDGSGNAMTVFEAENAGISIIVFPAMGIKASYYEPFALELQQNGISTATVDLRGNGHSSLRPGRKVSFNYSDTLRNDYLSAIGKMRQLHPGNKLYLLGHSLGGQLACLFASKHPDLVDGIILVASGNVHYKGWQGLARYKTLAGTQFIWLVSRLLGYFPGKKLGFGGLEAKGIITDWGRHARNGRYVLENDPFDYEQAMKQAHKPILAITFEGDGLASGQSARNLYGKFAGSPVEHHHLLRSDPLNEGFDHFNWAKKPESPVQLVCKWLTEQAT